MRELLAILLQHEVVVDCTQAYRLLHRQSSSNSGLFRTLDAQQLDVLMRERFVPESPRERREPLRPVTGPLLELAARRSSAFPGLEREVSYPELSAVLSAAYGTPPRSRPVPSAGGLYPLVVHALVREPVDPLEPGLWWYDPAGAELDLLRAGPIDVRPLFIPESTTGDLMSRGRPLLFVSADLERPARKYSNCGYRYALMEVGAAMQNAYLVAAELDLPIRAVGGFHDDRVHEHLDLPERIRPLLVLLLGT